MTISGNTTNWRDHWDRGVTAWDLGGPHPLFSVIFEELAAIAEWSQLKNWSVPGCGRAHDAAALAKMGAHVLASDIVDLAVQEAEKTYTGLKHLRVEVGDALIVKETEENAFDGVFDRAMLCAMNGEARTKYIDCCHRRLRTGGFFVSIPFAKVARPEAGPPFQITAAELRESFANGWSIRLLKSSHNGPVDVKILEEYLFIAQKD